MKTPDLSGRREFTREFVLSVLAGTTITIAGCGGGGGYGNPVAPNPTPSPSPSGPPSMTGAISANHGHSAVIAGADIVGGVAVSLNIRGQATHPHTVVLSAAEVTALRRGDQVSKTSSAGDTNQHTHTVTFRGPDGGGNPYDGY